MKKFWTFLAACFFYATASYAQDLAGFSVTSIQAANNTTAIIIKTGAGAVQNVEAFNNGATIAYVKLYDAATQTCGTGTPKARYQISAATVAPTQVGSRAGDLYVNGIAVCITTGFADSDTTAPAASTYTVNVHWR